MKRRPVRLGENAATVIHACNKGPSASRQAVDKSLEERAARAPREFRIVARETKLAGKTETEWEAEVMDQSDASTGNVDGRSLSGHTLDRDLVVMANLFFCFQAPIPPQSLFIRCPAQRFRSLHLLSSLFLFPFVYPCLF